MFLLSVSWIAFVMTSLMLIIAVCDIAKNGAPYGLNWGVLLTTLAIWVSSGHYIFDIV